MHSLGWPMHTITIRIHRITKLMVTVNNYKRKVCKVVPFSIMQDGYIIHNDIEV